MKCFNIFVLSIVLATVYFANAKPLLGIDTSISLPVPAVPTIPSIPNIPGIPDIPSMAGMGTSGTQKPDTSKEVESMDKSESLFLGYYPYYYGWPYYYRSPYYYY